ncbi:hypothetical protein PPYR_11645 [Photinus pyralis]|uniref:Protein Skeletor n=3 Tax=Photinus pyralis TaxID=7054 RepID=A0A5N4ABW5_PHOPY|nr:protein Skeletor, isoforms B/C [Photinus pyralis]KAB0794806.1 hypothetical protein PPYR_11645 [Photinus pyralis]
MVARTNRATVAFLRFFTFIVTLQSVYTAYLGKFIGKLSELHHGVSGEVYAIDARTLHLKDFTYDGQGPAAYFYAGNTRAPGAGGFRLTDENGNPEVIRRYRKENVILTLPEGKTLNSIKWFSVWCEEFTVNFGDVKIPRNFDYPRPRKIDALRGVHGVSSDNIVIVDAQTLLVPNLSYDGEAPDAKFWVGRGPKPSPQGVRVPDENGKEEPLRRYDRKTVVLTLPGDLTVFDIGHFGVWCEAFTVDFGHIQIPGNLNVPPSLRMLGVSPQSKLNCEVLYDDLAFEVRWAVAGDSIVLQLVSKLEDREYMSFGLSGDDSQTAMVGGDVAVAWVDKETLKGYAEDYYLDAKSQCSGRTGSCPDTRLEDNTNDIHPLNAAMVNGYSIVTYQRPLRASDPYDKTIYTNRSQPIIWAIGPLNQRDEVSFHSRWTKKDHFIDFGRPAKWNCPMPETDQPPMKIVTPLHQTPKYQDVTNPPEDYTEAPPSRTRKPQQRRRGESTRGSDSVAKDSERSTSKTRQNVRRGQTTSNSVEKPKPVPTPAPVAKIAPWDIPPIQCYEPEDGVFYAQMGPTGGKRGYPAITGHVGWGISWYINGLLIPEINVVRGQTYTFVVEGGLDPEVPAKYHPFYITDDPIGGYEHKTPEERAKIRIFAGARVDRDGVVHPTGVGRLCNWTPQGDREADDFESFGAYQRTLELKCDQGEPGVIQFTPNRNTPDTVYYHCFTHRYLGWKINVLDSCDVEGAPSHVKESVVHPDSGAKIDNFKESEDELEGSPSILFETRVKAPNTLINGDSKGMTELPPRPMVNSSTSTDKLNEEKVFTVFATQMENKQNESVTPQITELPVVQFEDVPISMTKMLAPPMVPPIFSSRPPYKPLAPQLLIKKPYYRPMMKNPMILKQFPYKFEDQLSIPSQIFPQHKKPMPQMYKKVIPVTFMERSGNNVRVEVSPEQASTEKEPRTTTESTFRQIINVAPSKMHYSENMPIAVNTGFKPETIVIEGGFKPIVSKENRYSKVEGPQLEYESEIGIIDVNMDKSTPADTPFFKNGKPLNLKLNLRNKGPMLVIKESRRGRGDAYDDEIADADERVDSYYLPPDNQRTKPVVNIMKPSNIDVAPGTVVSYDGKRVSGASLTAKYPNGGSIFDNRSSKAAEIIKTGPQYGPFRGELPPLDPNFIKKSATLFQIPRVLSRDLETPAPQEPTKLVLVRQSDGVDNVELENKKLS